MTKVLYLWWLHNIQPAHQLSCSAWNLFDGVCVLACSASDECSESTFWIHVRQFFAKGISFYFMVMKIVFMCSNMIDINADSFAIVVSGWVGLGHSADALSWVGSPKIDPRTTLSCLSNGWASCYKSSNCGLASPSLTGECVLLWHSLPIDKVRYRVSPSPNSPDTTIGNVQHIQL